ncbi:PI-actitoxin-Avd5a-like [Drosophila takahashii]|uniref:PI-actitoxin-Avd5a-like n=1 Tax=Drosophila takahashii TaxID=29030 RepID=UPI001CF91A7C|nr:serine protease inhibitor dipetalogastin-like [Drosophila takahashii]
MRCLALIALCLFALLGLAVGKKNPCECVNNFDPVCGSDSVTYISPCKLNCEARIQGRPITIKKGGRC